MSDTVQMSSQFFSDRAQIERATSGVQSAENLARQSGQSDRLEEVAQEFESLFLKQMLDTMRSTLNEENRLVDTGMAGEYFQDMLYEEYSKIMSKRGSFGIAELIVQQYQGS